MKMIAISLIIASSLALANEVQSDTALLSPEHQDSEFLMIEEVFPENPETQIEASALSAPNPEALQLETIAVVPSESSPPEASATPAPSLAIAQESSLSSDSAASIPLDLKEEESPAIQISLEQVFAGSPIVYTLLLSLSIASICIWLYTLLGLRREGIVPETVIKNLRNKLYSNQYEEAFALCSQHESFFCKMLSSGISARRHGLPVMLETMKAEGKRATASLWQRITLLNDIAILAPMIGLLGTVLGMFYAFYDLNRSMESITTLFDGLGISVGTTVAGLIVAIIAMVLQSLTKYRLVKLLTQVENEAHAFAVIIDSHASALRGEKV